MQDDVPSFLGIDLNRIVAFLGPYLAIAAGAIADWLFVHVHFLANFHVQANQIANAIAQAAVFGLTALVVWLGQQKWLDGFQKWAYSTGVQIANTPLPASYSQPAVIPAGQEPAAGLPPDATPEAAQGFGDAEPPASG